MPSVTLISKCFVWIILKFLRICDILLKWQIWSGWSPQTQIYNTLCRRMVFIGHQTIFFVFGTIYLLITFTSAIWSILTKIKLDQGMISYDWLARLIKVTWFYNASNIKIDQDLQFYSVINYDLLMKFDALDQIKFLDQT